MAEGGGERKRKAPLSFDWDELLPTGNSDDEEPLPLQVIPEAETPKTWSAVMEDGEESSLKDYNLRKMSIKELNDTVARMNSLIAVTDRLPDGGVKLRVRLKCLQAEVEAKTASEG